MQLRLPSLRWSVGGLLVVGLATKFLGLARQLIVAYQFGVSAELDIVLLGLIIPMAISTTLGGGMARAVVPHATKTDPVAFATLYHFGIRKLFKWGSILVGVLLLTLPLWINIFDHNATGNDYFLLVLAGVFGCIGVCGGIIAGFCGGLADARGLHVTQSIRLFMHNVVSVVMLIFLAAYLGPIVLALAYLISEWIQLALLVPVLNRSFKYADPREHSKEWKPILKMTIPAVLLTVGVSLNLVVDRYFAATLESGSVSGLNYADNFLNIAVGLMGTALAAPLFTRFSYFASKKDWKCFNNTLLLGIKTLIMIGVPLGIGLAAGAKLIIFVIFEKGLFIVTEGAFDAKGTMLATQALWGYAPGMAFTAMTALLISAALAKKQNTLAVIITLLSVILNWYLDFILTPVLGLTGIASATSAVSFFRVVALLLIIAPSLIISKNLWSGILPSVISSIILSVPLLSFYYIPLSILETPLYAILILIALIAWFVFISFLIWKKVLKKDWQNISELRIDVSEGLADYKESRPGKLQRRKLKAEVD